MKRDSACVLPQVLLTSGRHINDARNAFIGITAENQCVDYLQPLKAEGNAVRAAIQALELLAC